MAQDWYTPQEMQTLEAMNPCPYWQRLNPLGWCVEKWYAGGVFASAMNALALTGGMVALGAIIVHAAKIKALAPLVDFVKKSKEQASFLSNRRRRRRRRTSRARRGRA